MPDTDELSALDQAISQLPFVRPAPVVGGFDFWTVKPTGEIGSDIDTGEHYAELALIVAKQSGRDDLIPTIMRDMVLSGQFTALEAGFVMKVARAARHGVMN